MEFLIQNSIAFLAAFAKYKINTPLRMAHFLAQCHNETGGFTVFFENLNYSESGLLKTFPKYFNAFQAKAFARKPVEIANRVYGNRMGNNTPGDGYKYRGRGIIQLTGKDNYIAYKSYSGVDVVSNPDLAARVDIALDVAGWFWQKRNVNAPADKDDITEVTRLTNGGNIGLTNRIKLRNYYLSFDILESLKKKVAILIS